MHMDYFLRTTTMETTVPPNPIFQPDQTLKIVLVEDHQITADGIRGCLSTSPYYRLVAVAHTAADGCTAIKNASPHIAIIDLMLNSPIRLGDGLELVGHLHKKHPEIKILVCTARNDIDMADRAFKAGAHGYFCKEEPPGNLLLALNAITGGKIYRSPIVFVTAPPPSKHSHYPFENLTNSELQILHAMALGYTNKRIAVQSKRSVRTIEAHKEAIKRKLNLKDCDNMADAATDYLESLLR